MFEGNILSFLEFNWQGITIIIAIVVGAWRISKKQTLLDCDILDLRKEVGKIAVLLSSIDQKYATIQTDVIRLQDSVKQAWHRIDSMTVAIDKVEARCQSIQDEKRKESRKC